MKNSDNKTTAHNTAKSIGNGGAVKLTTGTDLSVAGEITGFQLPSASDTITVTASTTISDDTRAEDIDTVTYQGPGEWIFPAQDITVNVTGVCLVILG